MDYKLNIMKSKVVSKCRLCRRKINPREIRVRMIISDEYYGDKSMCLHTDCALKYIIKEVKKIKLDDVKKEMEKFKKIEDMLK